MKTAIIIPCYNEEKRLPALQIKYLVEHSDMDIYLANDGSKDKTVEVISEITKSYSSRCFLIDFKQNQGKSDTIYKAVNQINESGKYEYIGYFDADFSTPSKEVVRLVQEIESSDFEFVFGSRILLLNSGIQRKKHRHIIGRIILTIINLKFQLGIYDTQCGAKLFSKDIIEKAFDKPFKTSWLFDVEVFIRLQKQNLLIKGKEIPIYDWKDVDGSKLSWKSGFKILKEIIYLFKKY